MLHLGLDHVRGLFAAGELAEDKVQKIVAAAAHLDRAERAAVDQRLAGEGIERLGVRRVHDLATRLALEVAPDKAQLRARAARTQRHVRARLAADGMADLVAHLPAEQAAACVGALHRAVNDHYVTADTVTRSRGQILADTLVERLTRRHRDRRRLPTPGIRRRVGDIHPRPRRQPVHRTLLRRTDTARNS